MSIKIRNSIAAIPGAKTVYGHILKCAVQTGALDFQHFLTGRRHIILTFHRIRAVGLSVDPFDSCPSMAVEIYRQILNYVKSRFTICSLREMCNNRSCRDAAAVITFDDGWRDNYDVAFPILRELKIPATVFVTTGKIGSSTPFWQQSLGQCFRQAAEQLDEPAARELRGILDLPADRALTSELFRETVVRWKRADSYAERERCLARLETTTLADSDDSRCFLNTEEIREMAAAGVAFGSHTATHQILPQLSSSEIEHELTTSKADLENILGHEVDTIAYPNGQYSREVLQCARACGYRIGCTTRTGRVAIADDLLRLPRAELSFDRIDGLDDFFRIGFQWQTC